MLKRRQKRVLLFSNNQISSRNISRFSCSSKFHYIVLQRVFFSFFLSRRIQVYSHVEEISNMLYASFPSYTILLNKLIKKKKKPYNLCQFLCVQKLAKPLDFHCTQKRIPPPTVGAFGRNASMRLSVLVSIPFVVDVLYCEFVFFFFYLSWANIVIVLSI